MATDWYYFKGEQRLGPVTSQQLKAIARSGQLQPNSLVWKEGMANPQPASYVEGLFEASIPPPPPFAVAANRPTPQGKPQVSPRKFQGQGTSSLLWGWYKRYVAFILTLVWGVVTATWYAATVIFGDLKAGWETDRLKGELAKEQAALGEKVYLAGLGNPELRQRIANNDQAIQQAEASKSSIKAFAKKRQALLTELGTGAMAKQAGDPAIQERQQAVQKAQAALKNYEEHAATLVATRPPVDKRRAWIGAGVCGMALLAVVGDSDHEKSKVTTSPQSTSEATDSTGLSLIDGPVPIKSFIAALRHELGLFELSSPEDGYDVAGSPLESECMSTLSRFPGPYRFHMGSRSIGFGSNKRKLTILLFQADADKKLVQLMLAQDMELANSENKINSLDDLITLIEHHLLPGSNYRKAYRANIPQILGGGATLKVGKASVVTKLSPARDEIKVSIALDAD